MPQENAGEIHGAVSTESSRASSEYSVGEQLPQLHFSHRKQKMLRTLGLSLVTLDLAVLPITYYYALKYGTNLNLQEVFGVLTGIFGLINFTHYFVRSLKLFRSKSAPKWRPVGWTKWGMMEFLQMNILIIITLVEIELVAGTIPNYPIVRLCAMPPPTICFYLGFISCGSAILTSKRKNLPFNMSSTGKGSSWRPVLLAFIEDAGGVEGGGGVDYRKAVMKRWEVSPQFRSMIMWLSWCWGIGFILSGIVSTISIMELSEDVGFGIGWGLPWAWTAVQTILTVPFMNRRLKQEREEWGTKEKTDVEGFAA